MSYQQPPPGDKTPRPDAGAGPAPAGNEQPPGDDPSPSQDEPGRPDASGYGHPDFVEPGYSPPQYSAPTAARSTVPFIIVGVLVVIAVAVGLLFFVNRGGGPSPSGSDPVASVHGFLSALQDRKCDRARSFLTGNAKVQAEGSCNTGQLDRVRFTDPVVLHRSSVRASVNVKATIGGQSLSLRLGLRKVDGKWLISDLIAD
jgi:hypothetical protein